MMRHILTTSIIMAAVSLEATAIDAYGAKQLATNYFQEINGSDAACGEMQIVAIDSLHTSPAYYICQPADAPGYFIISAIEGTPELIAYSETDRYENGLPAPFHTLLRNYAQGPLRFASTPHLIAEQGYASNINPLIKSYWAQATPYNNLCPAKEGELCLTGCTATAMAQVMNYHQYPAVGTGIADKATLNHQKLGAIDLSEYPFDWENMLKTYQNVEYNEAQANAVATLMMAAGYAAQMDYNTNESGSYQEHARKALIENFGYSTSARIYLRNSYERSTWLSLIRKELEEGRPIMVAGQASGGGHAFICDGWGIRNTLHINWGWGEGFNCNVDVDVMAPMGSNDGYTRDMKFLMGIQPHTEGEDRTLPYNLDLCDSLKFTASNKMYVFPAVYNSGPERVGLSLGFCIRQGEEVVQFIDLNKSASAPFIGHSNPVYGILSLPALEDGDYTLQMVVKPQNTTEWMTVNPGDRTDGFSFSMSNGTMNFGELLTIGMVETTAIERLQATSTHAEGSYTLSGTRILREIPAQGLSICNGKIQFVK